MKLLFLSMVLIVVSFNATAEEPFAVVITLKAGNDHPTVEQVHQEGGLQPPPVAYMLSAFNAHPPAKVDYLMPLRAIGDAKDLMDVKPNWGRAKIERSLIVTYHSVNDSTQVLQAMRADEHILLANMASSGELHSSMAASARGALDPDWHLEAINWQSSPNAGSAFGHLGYVDTGAPTDRIEFEPFDIQTGGFLGGGLNISRSVSMKYGDRNIRNLRPLDVNQVVAGYRCDLYDSQPNDGIVYPAAKHAGHGSHVGGLLIANDMDNPGVCLNCNLSGGSILLNQCLEEVDDGDESDSVVFSFADLNLWPGALRHQVDSGRQSVNLSFGSAQNDDLCYTSNPPIECTVINEANARNIAVIASAGNHRATMTFPAFDRDVIGVGGIDATLGFWNQSPTNGNPLPPLDPSEYVNMDTSQCPFAGSNPPLNYFECGSNISKTFASAPGVFEAERYRRIDVVAPAQDVVSTLPLGSEYNPFIGDHGCTDLSDGALDGYGPCTGTSMAAPIITGVVQMIRSANPLLPIGDDDPVTLEGIRDVLLYSGSIYQTTGEHDPWMGFGLPDAQLAVETVLGISGGQNVKNRVTPLMVLHNDEFDDTVYTTFPQMALAYALADSGFYQNPAGIPSVQELPEYPVETVDGDPVVSLVPLAPIYVFTNRWNPMSQTESLIPLYRMQKDTVSSPGCVPGFHDAATCYVTDRSTVMITDVSELESFYTAGYDLQGIEGYLAPCANESCDDATPATTVYRVHETNSDNYYLTQITPLPGTSYEVLGAAFANFDFDNDGLTTGMEYLLGTNPMHPDTDGDGMGDGVEYPAAGVPFSDPLISDIIFEDGFE